MEGVHKLGSYELRPLNRALTEREQEQRGAKTASILGLKKNKRGFYKTSYGDKSDLGLFRMLEMLILDGET